MQENVKGNLNSDLEFRPVGAPQRVSEWSKWNRLGVIGGSALGKAAIAFPVLGYLILFNDYAVAYLKIHSSFCLDCSVSPRLYALYIGGFFIAVGSLLYTMFCPQVVDRHANAHDFYESEKDYYDTAQHRLFLINHIIALSINSYIAAEYMYPARSAEEMMKQTDLSELMGQHYFLQNRSMRWLRIAILWFYLVGFIFLLIPTAMTFFQVVRRGISTSFGL
ncbi:hypothetical protein [Bradyrhizobium sp. STM 3557]|uniref:hypothetical protein n=1 Tax=Bradyrhizobium sp. STM 3557 TaxID=578920 RepID=UPI00388E13EE